MAGVSQAAQGPACWICMEGGPDDGGEPLVPNKCACRGESVGYAHVSCVVNYAQTKLDAPLENAAFDDGALQAWTECPSCTQQYQGLMDFALSKEIIARTGGLPESRLALVALRAFALLNLVCHHTLPVNTPRGIP